MNLRLYNYVMYIDALDLCFSDLSCGGQNVTISNETECCDDDNGVSVMLSGTCYDCKETMLEVGGRGPGGGGDMHILYIDVLTSYQFYLPHAMQACDYMAIPPTPCHAGM